jgi:class 3 adenylate cyclase
MGLRAKLFFWVGLLFLLTAISSYILPRLFIQEDVVSLKQMFDDQVQKEREHEQETRKTLFKNRLLQDINSFNGTLLYVDKTDSVRNELIPKEDKNTIPIWQQLSILISYNPEIGFSCLQNNDLNISLVVDNPLIYSAQAIQLTENCNLVLLKTEEDVVPQTTFGPYIAIKFAQSPKEILKPSSSVSTNLKDKSSITESPLFYFYSPSILGFSEKTINELIELNPYLVGLPLENLENPQSAQLLLQQLITACQELEKILKDEKILNVADFSKWLGNKEKKETPEDKNKTPVSLKKSINVKNKNLEPLTYSINNITKNNVSYITKENITREYASIYLNSIENDPLGSTSPLGGTTFLREVKEFSTSRFIGGALLNKEIFFEDKVFDAKNYFSKNPPPKNSTPIAQGVALINDDHFKDYFIGNTLLIEDHKNQNTDSSQLTNPTFLTIGKSIIDPIRNTSFFPNEIVVFLDLKGNVEFALDNYTHEIPLSFFVENTFKDILNSSSGKISIRNIPYHFIQLEDYEVIPLRVFLLTPDALEPIYSLQKSVSSALIKIYDKLSYQLLLATLALLGIALIILGFLSKKITKPIIMLAKATEGVVQGNYSNIDLPQVDPQEKDELSTLTLSFAKMIKGLQDKERIRGMLDKVVSKEIASEILKKGAVSLGGESKIVTILFADIRGFTSLTEYLDPQEVILLLNHYMTSMTNIIELEGGVIDKYVGDAIMALYGAPVEMVDGAMRAIKTAILMIQKLKAWNEERTVKGLPIIEIGIGIHTGKVVAGNMGADTRLNYTVLGANVNFASRLCSAAKPMQIRISKEALNTSGLKGQLDVEELEPFIYKGFSEPIVAYAVKGFKM